MREILFKGKRIDNGEWVEGNLVFSPDADEEWRAIIIPIRNSYMFSSGNEDEDLGFENWHKVDLETVCQYTGLTDRNGSKIWENDIVEILKENDYFQIEWQEDTASFVINSDSFTVTFDNYWGYEMEVVGNIFIDDYVEVDDEEII